MPVTYGKAEVNCACCQLPPVEFDSEEGRRRRRLCVGHYRRLCLIQLVVSMLAVGVGLTSAVLAFMNPTYPYFMCYALVNSILMLVGAFFGRQIGQSNLDNEVPPRIRKYVIVHYVMCIISMTFSGLTVGYGSMGLAYCLEAEGSTIRDDCTPHHDLKTAFVAVDIFFGIILAAASIVGSVFFCKHAQTLGFKNRQQRLENEVEALRAEVGTLRQAQQAQPAGGVQGFAQYHPPPPSYEQSQNVPGGSLFSVGGPTQYGVAGGSSGGNVRKESFSSKFLHDF